LLWGGYSVDELAVISAFDKVGTRTEVMRRDGFSISELVAAVGSLDLGVVAIDRYLTEAEFKEAVRIEPLIVRLSENSGKPGYGRGHFTIVDGFSQDRGFRRADSADGSYTFHKEKSFIAAALYDSAEHGSRIPVIYLRRGSAPIARSAPVTVQEQRSLPDMAKARLLEAIDPITSGTTQMTVSAGFGRMSFLDPGLSGIRTREDSRFGSVQIRHGLDNATELSGELLLRGSDLGLTLQDGTTIPLGKREGGLGPLVVGLTRRVDVSLPPDWRLVVGLAAQVYSRPRVGNVSGSLTALWQLDERWSLRGGGAVSADREASRLLYTAALNGGAVRYLSRRTALGAEVSRRFPLNYSGPEPISVGASVHHAFGSQWAAQLSFEKTVTGMKKFDATTFGVAVTYQFARSLGR
jgi:hypothetical protein